MERGIRRETRRLTKIDRDKLRTAPLGTKEQVLKRDKKGRQRRKEEEKRRGKKLNPAAFTRHMERTHKQQAFRAIRPKRFTLPKDFGKRTEKAIRGGKNNRVVGADGLHVEMFQAAPAACAWIIMTWWATVEGLGIFPVKWAEGILCLLLKKREPKGTGEFPPGFSAVPRTQSNRHSVDLIGKRKLYTGKRTVRLPD